ncbi:DUF1259 domain-containing protein [Streptomyces sp. ET3-23]|uniref:DUF1259 domain-containing protein n=1 Tax=Streptomyces sp. ET3-23 TaxID=2885643 RepID=UPI001D11F0B9|nr:DUF1259 domain-containing protein [Streptomyces sp. ET3-23]MCC2279882.1 DUF1259 domain-containing protein [Streptomyces sp. ET3-23]
MQYVNDALSAHRITQTSLHKHLFTQDTAGIDRALPRMTGSTPAFIFQPVGGDKALLTGDLVMTAKEVPDTLRVLRKGPADPI